MKFNSIKDQLYYSTVMIECLGDNTAGTAFFLSKKFGDLSRVYLVTNKHVVQNKTKCRIQFHRADNLKGENRIGDFIYSFSDEEWANGWKFHNDENVDLAVFNLTDVMAKIYEQGDFIFARYLSTDMIQSKEEISNVIAMEKVFFVGYPNAFKDTLNNLPIARSGYLATPLYVDFEGNEAFLLDASIFEGSSGSPICVVNENFETYCDTEGNARVNGRIILAGVNSSTVRRNPDKQYLNIGYAWKAHKILEIMDQNSI